MSKRIRSIMCSRMSDLFSFAGVPARVALRGAGRGRARVTARHRQGEVIRRRNGNAEAEAQAAIVAWIRLVAPNVVAFAIPNGGLRTKSEAAKLRWIGVLAGIPDLCVVAPGGRAFFIEVKAPGAGVVSPVQWDMIDRLRVLGSPTEIGRASCRERVLWQV